MYIKLLRKIKKDAKKEFTINSITRENGIVTGMSYSYNSDCYKGLFMFGDTEKDVERKAWHIYYQNNRHRYIK